LVGISASSFGSNLFERIEAANIELKSLVLDKTTSILSKHMKMVINEHKLARSIKVSQINMEISKVKQTNNLDEVKENLGVYFKTVVSILGEISGFLSNEFILKDELWFESNQELLLDFVNAIVELSLLAETLKC